MIPNRTAAVGSDLDEIVERLRPLPTETAWLLELANDPTVGVDRLLRTLGRDPRLSDFLIRLSGAGYYGRRRKVGSLREALVLLGNRRVAMMAFAGKMGQMMRRRLARYGYEPGELWRHSLGVAYGAAFLLRRSAEPDRGELGATAGLLHDVGKLVIHQRLAGASRIGDLATDEQEYLARERSLAGFDHAEAGARLLGRWGLPAAIVTAVRHHHEPGGAMAEQDVAGAVHDADRICNLLGLGPSASTSARPRPSVTDLPAGEDAAALCSRLFLEVGKLEQLTRGMT